jgi:hypothetical protein
VPVAANCCVEPVVRLAPDGEMPIAVSTGVMVRAAAPVAEAKDAKIMVDPVCIAWARPGLPGALPTAAAVDGLALQAAVLVRSCELPSE